MQQQNIKEGQKSTDLTKKREVFKRVPTADSWICAEITNCRGKASTHLSKACRCP